MPVPVSRLDDSTVEYLQTASRSEYASLNCPGVLVWRLDGMISSPRSGAGWCVFFGLVLIAAAAVVGAVDAPRAKLLNKAVVGGSLLGVGTMVLLTGVSRYRLPGRDNRLGKFLFADSCRIWEVVDGYVATYEYADDLTASGYRHFHEGSYTHTRIVATCSGFRSRSWNIIDGDLAQRLLGFLQVVGHLRRSTDDTYRRLKESGSGYLGRVATLIMDDVDPDAARTMPMAIDPAPAPVDEGGPGWGGVFARWLFAAALGAAAVFGLWKGSEFLRDEKLFAAAAAEPKTAVGAADAYLKEFPDGRHVTEVQNLRDDKLFETGKLQSEGSNSPGGLRNYLGDKRNTRHRAEATQLIGVYYERAVADLKERATTGKGGKEQIDAELINTLVGVIEGLKNADDPVLTVGFIADVEPEPLDPVTKMGEDETYKKHLTEGRFKDSLKSLERTKASGSALVSHQGTFDQQYTETREGIIFTRLSDAINRGIKADILTLRRAGPGTKPNIEVRYRIFPAGFVLPFNEVDDDGKAKRTIGLVREYFIDWTLTFRPPGGGKETQYRTETRPGPNLLYRMEAGDPDWAIYAVSLYSAFYDLSDKMIRAFGQDPGPAPGEFTFAGDASQRNDKPARPGN